MRGLKSLAATMAVSGLLLAACGGGGSSETVEATATPEPVVSVTTTHYGTVECDGKGIHDQTRDERSITVKECWVWRDNKVGRISVPELWRSDESVPIHTDIELGNMYGVYGSGVMLIYQNGVDNGVANHFEWPMTGLYIGGTRNMDIPHNSDDSGTPLNGYVSISSIRRSVRWYWQLEYVGQSFVSKRGVDNPAFWNDIPAGDITGFWFKWIGENAYAMGIERP